MNWYKKAQIQESPEIQEFEIRQFFINDLRDKVEKLQTRAARLGVPPIQFTISEPYKREVGKTSLDEPIYDNFFKATLQGEPPVIAGWQLAGRIIHTPEGNVVNTVPGVVVPEVYRTNPPDCEHCCQSRNRNDTFLVYNPTTQIYKQIGSSCLKDFLGHNDPKQHADYLERLSGLFGDFASISAGERDEDMASRGGGQTLISPLSIATVARALIRQHGFISSTKARELENGTLSSGNLVSELMFGGTITDRYGNVEDPYQQMGIERPTQEDAKFAQEAIEWAKSQVGQTRTEYMANLSVAAANEIVEPRMIGLLTSIIPAYQRHLGWEAEKKKEQEDKPMSEHVGSVGDKIIAKVTFERQHDYEGNYGSQTFAYFKEGKGDLFKWHTKPGNLKVEKDGFLDPIDPGTSLIIFGTIKGHEEYKSTKSTNLTRAKLFRLDDDKNIKNYSKKATLNLL